MNGFLLIDKPSGLTSAQCVYQLRKVLGNRKVGHCGTLDPLATGVLPICVGEATKFSTFISGLSKEYLVKILFGVYTDTGDVLGKVISQEEFTFTKQELELALKNFIGKQLQTPPMYSALKIKGKPLYRWVRKGIYLKRDARKITVKSINLESFNNDIAVLRITCSKGTYIRTLVESIGKFLGTTATVKELRRTKIGQININILHKLNSLKNGRLNEELIPCGKMLEHLPKVSFDLKDIKKIRNGLSVDYNTRLEKEKIIRIYEETGSFVGIGQVDTSSRVSPKRLLSIKKDFERRY